MARIVLVLFAVFLLLTVLRGLRIFLAAFLRQPGSTAARPGVAHTAATATIDGPNGKEMTASVSLLRLEAQTS